MKNKSVALIVLLLLTSLGFWPTRVSACACCSDEGDYRLGLRKPSAYQLSQLEEIRFGKNASLIETQQNVAEEIKSPAHQAESYSVSASFTGNIWKLTFRDGNESGTLTLPLPARMWNYAVDTHDGQKSEGGGPLLYKEWRFEGRVTGTGIFRNGIIPQTRYFLVFQGRGNSCEDAGSFSHWRLEIIGRKARYAFYGELAEASNRGRNESNENLSHSSMMGSTEPIASVRRVGAEALALLLFPLTTRIDSALQLSL